MKDTAQTALTHAKRTQARAIFFVLLAGSLWGCIGLFSRTLSALSLIHISEPTRPTRISRMPSSA